MKPPTHICKTCMTSFRHEEIDNEWMLWLGWAMIGCGLLFLTLAVLWIPGIVLLVWAYRMRKPKCPGCQSKKSLLLADSPAGQMLALERERKLMDLAASAKKRDAALPA